MSGAAFLAALILAVGGLAALVAWWDRTAEQRQAERDTLEARRAMDEWQRTKRAMAPRPLP